MAKSQQRRGKSASAVATTEPQVETAEQTATETQAETPASRRRIHVDPSEFMALKNELQMSNKEIAQAIERTLARVSELTVSKGASVEIFERYEQAVRSWREANPIQQAQ